MDTSKFILFGGIPRSGTTLTCHLFNQVPGTHALIESMDIGALVKLGDCEQRINYINEYMTDMYEKITRRKPININVIDKQDTNTFAETISAKGQKRQSKIIKKQPTVIDRVLNDNFKLILKHPNAFVALLPELIKSFNVFVQIRHPIAILASWNTLDHPLSRGHAPMAEAIDTQLKQRLKDIDDDLDRQVALLDWYYRVIHECLPMEKIIRYEDVINSNGEILRKIVQQGYGVHGRLENKNHNTFYNDIFIAEAQRILEGFSNHSCWKFY